MDVDPAPGACCQPDTSLTPEKKVAEVDVDFVRKSVPGIGAFTTRGARTKRKLFLRNKQSLPPWTQEETESLVLFLMLHTDSKTWATHKNFRFWDEAGSFVQLKVHSPHLRSGKH